jgi:CelD/BcsL family acetyltransferase involved in cellulose biosynthesis
MRGMRSVRIYDTIAELPSDALTALGHGGLFTSAAWWSVVEKHAIPADASAGYAVVEQDDHIVGIVPVLRQRRRIDALTTPYTCVYAPILTEFAAEAFGRACRGAGVCRIDSIPVEWDGLASCLAGVRRGGLVPLRFDHFGNWSQDVTDTSWRDYLAGRPGALRETVRRRLRQAEKLPGARFEILHAASEMDRAAEVYEDVYGRSWKEPEPFPRFNVALIRTMAGLGVLRLGVWWIEAVPVAVQMWIVWQGEAIVLKLAHDEAFKAHSPGTVLTALMLRHLLDQEQVRRIDFGRGDDSYKQGWVSERRQRIGFLLANPWHPRGAAALARDAVRRVRNALRA